MVNTKPLLNLPDKNKVIQCSIYHKKKLLAFVQVTKKTLLAQSGSNREVSLYVINKKTYTYSPIRIHSFLMHNFCLATRCYSRHIA